MDHPNATPHNADGDDQHDNSSFVRSRNKLHWNLRSFHLEDDSFRGRDTEQQQQQRCQSAKSIFGQDQSGGSGTSGIGSARSRTALVDGKQVCFELQENVTQRPTTDREARLKHSGKFINAEHSHWEVRARLWMVQFSLIQVTVAYFLLFLLMNVFFAALFWAHPDKCCDDPDMTFGQVFAFTIQTSSTIGYGTLSPSGMYANFLVVVLNYVSVLLNTVLAGLLFNKFVTPVAKLQFSDVITYSNCNGLPCLQLRVANADGGSNKLTDVTARLTHLFEVRYKDEDGQEKQFAQQQALELLNDQSESLPSVWTLTHVINETSPLFGLNLGEFPGNQIIEFGFSVHAVHDITQSPISAHAGYMVEDILIGHSFEDQISWNKEARELVVDYAKLSCTKPAPVWYPKPSRS